MSNANSNGSILFAFDNNNNDDESKRLALAAVAIAIAAFMVSFAQAALQYLTSPQREKCLVGAIGTWSRFTNTRWDFSTWRIRVRYAKIDFSIDKLLQSREIRRLQLRVWLTKHKLVGRCRIERRSSYASNYGIFDIADDFGIAIRNDNSSHLSFWDLNWRQKFSWIGFILQKRTATTSFSRAGWTNWLAGFGVKADESLIVGFENADIIPSSMDVPIQTINIHQIGLLCFVMGMKNLIWDPEAGQIEGQNRYIRVSTLSIPGVGQVVSFDGDWISFEQKMDRIPNDTIKLIAETALGHIIQIGFSSRPYLMDGMAILYAMVNRWEQIHWTTYQDFMLEE